MNVFFKKKLGNAQKALFLFNVFKMAIKERNLWDLLRNLKNLQLKEM